METGAIKKQLHSIFHPLSTFRHFRGKRKSCLGNSVKSLTNSRGVKSEDCQSETRIRKTFTSASTAGRIIAVFSSPFSVNYLRKTTTSLWTLLGTAYPVSCSKTNWAKNICWALMAHKFTFLTYQQVFEMGKYSSKRRVFASSGLLPHKFSRLSSCFCPKLNFDH